MMMTRAQAIAFLILIVILLSLPDRAAAQTQSLISDQVLVETLRSGGYNIYFRHVATDWSQSDDVHRADDWLSCDPAAMRQLSARGRTDAELIGKAIQKLQIPVAEVLASPYCRTMDTARLMNLGTVKASPDVMNLRAAEYFGGRSVIVASARKLLATAPESGSNRVIVGHGNVAREATPVYPAEGEGIVFQPDGQGGFVLVGRITPAGWSRIIERLDN
jgi:hypothetical protein